MRLSRAVRRTPGFSCALTRAFRSAGADTAPPDAAQVLAWTKEAEEAMDLGDFGGAAALFAKAVDAALALSGEDCLIAAHLRAEEALALLAQSRPGAADKASAEAMTAHAYKDVVPPMLAALERRRASATLLPGRCRPEEVAWALGRPDSTESDAHNAAMGPLVGYSAFLTAASVVVLALQEPEGAVPVPRAAVRTFVEAALVMVLLPRELDAEGTWLLPEMIFLSNFMRLVDSRTIGPHLPEYKPMLDTWARLRSSSTVQKRGGLAAAMLGMLNPSGGAAGSAQQVTAGVKAQGGRCCALTVCGAPERRALQFPLCSSCKTVAYCSKQHQTAHWPDHKAACKAARKQAALDLAALAAAAAPAPKK